MRRKKRRVAKGCGHSHDGKIAGDSQVVSLPQQPTHPPEEMVIARKTQTPEAHRPGVGAGTQATVATLGLGSASIRAQVREDPSPSTLPEPLHTWTATR